MGAQIEASLARAGQLFVAALVLSATLLAVYLVESERQRRADEERALARDQIERLRHVASRANTARDRLHGYLIAEYGGYGDTSTTLRQLARDLRDARRTLRHYSVDLPHETVKALNTATKGDIARFTSLAYGNSEVSNTLQDEPILKLIDHDHGSLRTADRLADLALEDLARYLWFVTLRPAQIVSRQVAPADIEAQILAVSEQVKHQWARDTRLIAATTWEDMLRVSGGPAGYGVTADARGQVSLNSMLSDFEALRRVADYTGSLEEELGRVTVQPLGLGVPMTVSGVLALAPWLIAGLLAAAALIWQSAGRAAGGMARRAEVALPLPDLLSLQRRRAPMLIRVGEVVFFLSPAIMYTMTAAALDQPLVPMLAPALANVLLAWEILSYPSASPGTEI